MTEEELAVIEARANAATPNWSAEVDSMWGPGSYVNVNQILNGNIMCQVEHHPNDKRGWCPFCHGKTITMVL